MAYGYARTSGPTRKFQISKKKVAALTGGFLVSGSCNASLKGRQPVYCAKAGWGEKIPAFTCLCRYGYRPCGAAGHLLEANSESICVTALVACALSKFLQWGLKLFPPGFVPAVIKVNGSIIPFILPAKPSSNIAMIALPE